MTSLSKGLVWHDIDTFHLHIFVKFHCYTLVGDSSACKRHKTTFYMSWLIFLFKWVVFCNVTSCLHGFVYVDWTLGCVLDLIIGCIYCLSLWIELWPDGFITQCSFNWIGDLTKVTGICVTVESSMVAGRGTWLWTVWSLRLRGRPSHCRVVR